MTSVFLMDQHMVSMERTKALLSKYDDVQIVGRAFSVQEALHGVKDLLPDVVIMEAVMPYLHGMEPSLQIHCIETTYQIKQIDEKISVIILTACSGRDLLKPLLNAGISAYVLKRDSASGLYSAIQAAKKGKNYFSKPVRAYLSDGDEGSEKDLEKNPPPDVAKSLLTLGVLLSYLIH